MKKIKVPVLGLVNEKTVSGFAFCGASAGSSSSSGSRITYSSSGSSGSGSCGSSSSSVSGSSSYGVSSSSLRTGSGSSCGRTGSSSSGLSTPVTISVSNPSKPSTPTSITGVLQTPTNSSDVHCDINAYNMATQAGYNGGTWDGNKVTVDQIYTNSYKGKGSGTAVGDAGYGFVDIKSNGGYDHMFYYTNTGSGLTIYDSNGVNPLKGYNGDSLLNGYYKGSEVKFVGLEKR